MNERTDEPGYPPSPAPRTEPYSVDDPTRSGDWEQDGVRDGESQPADGAPAPAEDEHARADTPPSPYAAGAPWQDPAPTGAAPDRHDTGAPWQQDPARSAAPSRDDGGAPWRSGPAADAPPHTGATAWRTDESRQQAPAPWRTDPSATQPFAPDDATRPFAAPQPGTTADDSDRHLGQGLPWSSPDDRARPGTQSYPPSGAPPEFTTAGGSAASPAALPYAWRDPAARPWQSPGAHPPPQQEGPAPSGRRRRDRRTVGLGVVVLLLLVALLGGIVLGALGARALWPAPTSGALPAPSSPAATGRAPESVAGIAAAALDSTVFIEVLGGGTASSGSGMVLREDGYLITNNHVIAAAGENDGRVSVTFADGTQEAAEIVGSTSDYDLAVLQVDRDGLTPLTLADSDALVVGDPVVAVGAPLGLEGTVTSGIISALNRPVQAGGAGETFINAIQTDAAINPGNSGGPLINTAGEVVGINTAIAQAGGRQTGSIGLGFAIPSNQVRRTAEQIIETGRATYPVIGVALDTRYQGEGVQVLEDAAADTPAVTPGGPGEEAGIEPGDVITHFDGQPVTTPSELIVAVRSRAPGDTVVLTVLADGGQEREVEVVLDETASE